MRFCTVLTFALACLAAGSQATLSGFVWPTHGAGNQTQASLTNGTAQVSGRTMTRIEASLTLAARQDGQWTAPAWTLEATNAPSVANPPLASSTSPTSHTGRNAFGGKSAGMVAFIVIVFALLGAGLLGVAYVSLRRCQSRRKNAKDIEREYGAEIFVEHPKVRGGAGRHYGDGIPDIPLRPEQAVMRPFRTYQ